MDKWGIKMKGKGAGLEIE